MLRNEFRKIRGCPIWWATGTSSASWGRGSTKTRTHDSAGDHCSERATRGPTPRSTITPSCTPCCSRKS